ncbi:hypothetical protein JCM10213_008708 [Rhodosporidiobolus nylandii]
MLLACACAVVLGLAWVYLRRPVKASPSSTPPSPPPRPVPLPLDIYAEVLDHLAEELPSPAAKNALIACCLASKDFRHLAYPLLHRRVVLHLEPKHDGLEPKHDDDSHGFTAESMHLALRLAGSPRLAAKVRHLALQTAPRKNLPFLWLLQFDYAAQTAWEALAAQLRPGLSLKLPNLPLYCPSKRRHPRDWDVPMPLMHKVRQLEVEYLYNIDELQAVPSLRTLSLDRLLTDSFRGLTPPAVTHLALNLSYWSPGGLDNAFRHLGNTLTHITLFIPLYSNAAPPDLSLVPGLTTLVIRLPATGHFDGRLARARRCRARILNAVERLLTTAGWGGARSRFSLELRVESEADEAGKKKWANELRRRAKIGWVKSEATFSSVGEVDASALGLTGPDDLGWRCWWSW